MHRSMKAALAMAGLAVVSAGATVGLGQHAGAGPGGDPPTKMPIQHLIVVFQENVSFDHYFGTYPYATNTDGSTFKPKPGTPTVNGLNAALLTSNPNGANPVRLTHSQPLTCDQDHDYTPEQKAVDGGANDAYIANTNNNGPCTSPDQTISNVVMDYYDGNTVTALWNYAQRWAMSDNSFNTQFGPSTPGALNLVSGQTHGATPAVLPGVTGNGTDYGDADPMYDDCSAGSTIAMSGTNVGDLLNAAHVTWGWFQGGFRPTTPATTSTKAVCGSHHTNVGGASVADYSAHHEPFEYYASTSNPHHLPPSSVAAIGTTDQANHQYDLSDFNAVLGAKNLPAVSFLKAAKFEDGHAGYSDPLDEQTFLVNTINEIESSSYWNNAAIVISYDDSDGWYDHVVPPIVNTSQASEDSLNATGKCGNATPLNGYEDRCGYGPRLPLLVISPFARQNYVDNALTDQSSILRFIEDNWLGGERIGGGSYDQLAGSIDGMFDFQHSDTAKLILDPSTGEKQ